MRTRAWEGIKPDPNFWKKVGVVTVLLVCLGHACHTLSAAPSRAEWRGRLELTGQPGEGYYALGQVLAIMASEKDTRAREILSRLEGREVRIIIEEVGGEE